MSKSWLASYPTGVPAEIDPQQYRSLADMAERSFAEFAARPAYVQMDKSINYGELDRDSQAFGAWLQQRAGLKRGDRVAIMMPNVLQYPIALFGVLRAGGTVVNTNPLYTARELEHQLRDSGAETIVILENFAHVLQEVIGRTRVRTVIVTSVGELLGFPKGNIVDFVVRRVRKAVPPWQLPGASRFAAVLREGRHLQLTKHDLHHGDLAFLQYTGGTTGVSKGAMLSHGNMVANVLQSTAWTEPVLPRDEVGIAITALPLYHIFALTANCILFLRLGWTNILITNPRDFPGFVAELKKYRFTYISGVNTLFNALLHTPGFEQVDFSKLRCTLGGGMAVQRAVAERWKQVTGCILTQAWGLTETSPAACINPIAVDFYDSIGLPNPFTQNGLAENRTDRQSAEHRQREIARRLGAAVRRSEIDGDRRRTHEQRGFTDPHQRSQRQHLPWLGHEHESETTDGAHHSAADHQGATTPMHTDESDERTGENGRHAERDRRNTHHRLTG